MIAGIKSSANYKWWAFSTIAVGTFLSVVDHGSVLVALPSIERHFGSDLPTVQWIIVGYALAISVLILPMGRLGDIIGRKQVYVGGMVIFVSVERDVRGRAICAQKRLKGGQAECWSMTLLGMELQNYVPLAISKTTS